MLYSIMLFTNNGEVESEYNISHIIHSAKFQEMIAKIRVIHRIENGNKIN